MGILKKLLIIPPLILGVIVFMYMKGQKQSPQVIEAAEVKRQVRVVEVQQVGVVPRVYGFGEVVPGKEWAAIAQVSGEIIKVDGGLKKGSLLNAGTVLVTISPDDYELAIVQADANIRSTEAKIAELDVERENTQNVLEIEKQSLKIREGELARQTSLVKKGTISRTSYDKERRDTFAQRKKVQDLENSLRLIPTQVAVQKEQREVYKSQAQSARLDLKRTIITLPFDGRLSEVNAEVAQFAQKGQTLAKIDGVAAAEIEAQIPVEKFMGLLQAAGGERPFVGVDSRSLAKIIKQFGLKVTVRLNSGGRYINWDARLARISDVVDPKTRTIGVIAIVDGAYAQFIPGKRPPLAKGMFVEMEISARALKGQLIVPRLALNGSQLYVAGKDNRLEIREVEVGLIQGDFAVISTGLSAGEKIVVSDLTPAINNMLLSIETDLSLSGKIVKQASRKAGAAEQEK